MNQLIGAMVGMSAWAVLTAIGISIVNSNIESKMFTNAWALWLIIFALMGAVLGSFVEK